MKHSKKILSLLVFITLILSLCVPVMAAPVDELKAALTKIGVPQNQVANVVDYLQKVKITDSQYQSLMTKIDETSAILNGKTDITALSDADTLLFEGKIAEAAQLIGLKATFSNGQDGNIILDVKDSKNTIIFSMDSMAADNFLKSYSAAEVKSIITKAQEITKSTTFSPVNGDMKQTGTNYGSMLVIGLTLVVTSFAWITINKRVQKCQ